MIEHIEDQQQEHAANIPLSPDAISEFQALWREVAQEDIDTKTAEEYGRQLLSMFKFVYKPLTKKQFDQLGLNDQPEGAK